MKEELQQIYDSTPEDQPLSRLEPYRELILRWRRQGRTYRKIKALLAAELSVNVSTTRLFYFVRSRTRPRKPKRDVEIEPLESTCAAAAPVERKPAMTPEERAALRASYDQPLFPTEEKKPLFVRRPGPIRNLNNETKGDK